MNLQKAVNAGFAATVMAGTLVAAVGPSSAAFATCGAPPYNYLFDHKTLVLLPGDYHTDWADPGATVAITKGRTTTWTVGGTATGKTELSAILAKAEMSLSISVTYSWANTNSETISQKVPKGDQQGRLRRYADGYKFTVTKQHLDANRCAYVTDWVDSMSAPKDGGDTSVVMEYRKKPPGGIAAAGTDLDVVEPIAVVS